MYFHWLRVACNQQQYYYLQAPETALEIVDKPLEMTNVSNLPLTVTLMLNYPFSIVDTKGDVTDKLNVYLESNMTLKVRDSIAIAIFYCPILYVIIRAIFCYKV